MLGQALHGREQAEELDEADLFDAAGDVEPASRTGLYPIGAEGEGEETSDSDDAVDELGEFDDIPTLHTPPNPELRPGRAFAMSMPRERTGGLSGGWPTMTTSFAPAMGMQHSASLSTPIYIPASVKNAQRVEGFGAAFEDPLFAVPAPASPDTADAFLPPHEIVRAKLEQSAPVAGFISQVERGVNKTRVLHTRNAIMRATGFLDTSENRAPGASPAWNVSASPRTNLPASALTRTFDADLASSIEPKRSPIPGFV